MPQRSKRASNSAHGTSQNGNCSNEEHTVTIDYETLKQDIGSGVDDGLKRKRESDEDMGSSVFDNYGSALGSLLKDQIGSDATSTRNSAPATTPSTSSQPPGAAQASVPSFDFNKARFLFAKSKKQFTVPLVEQPVTERSTGPDPKPDEPPAEPEIQKPSPEEESERPKQSDTEQAPVTENTELSAEVEPAIVEIRIPNADANVENGEIETAGTEELNSNTAIAETTFLGENKSNGATDPREDDDVAVIEDDVLPAPNGSIFPQELLDSTVTPEQNGTEVVRSGVANVQKSKGDNEDADNLSTTNVEPSSPLSNSNTECEDAPRVDEAKEVPAEIPSQEPVVNDATVSDWVPEAVPAADVACYETVRATVAEEPDTAFSGSNDELSDAETAAESLLMMKNNSKSSPDTSLPPTRSEKQPPQSARAVDRLAAAADSDDWAQDLLPDEQHQSPPSSPSHETIPSATSATGSFVSNKLILELPSAVHPCSSGRIHQRLTGKVSEESSSDSVDFAGFEPGECTAEEDKSPPPRTPATSPPGAIQMRRISPTPAVQPELTHATPVLQTELLSPTPVLTSITPVLHSDLLPNATDSKDHSVLAGPKVPLIPPSVSGNLFGSNSIISNIFRRVLNNEPNAGTSPDAIALAKERADALAKAATKSKPGASTTAASTEIKLEDIPSLPRVSHEKKQLAVAKSTARPFIKPRPLSVKRAMLAAKRRQHLLEHSSRIKRGKMSFKIRDNNHSVARTKGTRRGNTAVNASKPKGKGSEFYDFIDDDDDDDVPLAQYARPKKYTKIKREIGRVEKEFAVELIRLQTSRDELISSDGKSMISIEDVLKDVSKLDSGLGIGADAAQMSNGSTNGPFDGKNRVESYSNKHKSGVSVERNNFRDIFNSSHKSGQSDEKKCSSRPKPSNERDRGKIKHINSIPKVITVTGLNDPKLKELFKSIPNVPKTATTTKTTTTTTKQSLEVSAADFKSYKIPLKAGAKPKKISDDETSSFWDKFKLNRALKPSTSNETSLCTTAPKYSGDPSAPSTSQASGSAKKGGGGTVLTSDAKALFRRTNMAAFNAELDAFARHNKSSDMGYYPPPEYFTEGSGRSWRDGEETEDEVLRDWLKTRRRQQAAMANSIDPDGELPLTLEQRQLLQQSLQAARLSHSDDDSDDSDLDSELRRLKQQRRRLMAAAGDGDKAGNVGDEEELIMDEEDTAESTQDDDDDDGDGERRKKRKWRRPKVRELVIDVPYMEAWKSVFLWLDTPSKVTCLRVCKVWQRTLAPKSEYWPTLKITKRSLNSDGGAGLELRQILERLVKRQPLSIILEDVSLSTDDVIYTLSALKSVVSLHLVGCEWPCINAFVTSIDSIPKTLVKLAFKDMICGPVEDKQPKSDSPFKRVFMSCSVFRSRITELSLSGPDISDADVRFIANQFPRIESLDLSNCTTVSFTHAIV